MITLIMRIIAFTIVLVVIQVQAKEPNQIEDDWDSIGDTADNFGYEAADLAQDGINDDLVSKHFDRAFQESVLHHADLDDTTLGKLGHSIRMANALPARLQYHQRSHNYPALHQEAMLSREVQVAVGHAGPNCGVWFSSSQAVTSRHAASRLVARAAVTAQMPWSEISAHYPKFNVATGELDASEVPDEMGVYVVLNKQDKAQYIGLSKNVRKSVEKHAEVIGRAEAPSVMYSIRCLETPGQSKEQLQDIWKSYIKASMDSGAGVPPGNLPENAPGSDPRWRGQSSPTKPPLRLAGVRDIRTMADALEAIEETVKKHPVVLFMKGTPTMPQCGFSARSIGMLGAVGADLQAVNVLDPVANPLVREAIKVYTEWPTIPQLFANGEFVGGCDIMTQMYESGELKAKLKGAASGEPGGGDSGNTPIATAAAGKVELIDDPSRPTASSMSKILNDSLNLQSMKIQDDSAAHAGDAGALEMGLTGESHFKLYLVSSDFEGMSAVQRQRKVFDVLGDVIQRIHAISLDTKTPAELPR